MGYLLLYSIKTVSQVQPRLVCKNSSLWKTMNGFMDFDIDLSVFFILTEIVLLDYIKQYFYVLILEWYF